MKYIIITNEQDALKAVESDGGALQYVKDQTEAVCLKAVPRPRNAHRRRRCPPTIRTDRAAALKR